MATSATAGQAARERPATRRSAERNVIRAATAGRIEFGRVEPEPLEQAAEPLDHVREAAFRAGYEDGRRRAAEEARAAAERAAAELEARIGAGLAFLENAALLVRAQMSEELDQLAKGATVLAMSLTETVLQREVALAANPGAEAIARALALVPGDAPAVVRCNPADLELLGPATRASLILEPDPEVVRGGCVLDTGATLVDARIETALARVRAVLAEAGGPDE